MLPIEKRWQVAPPIPPEVEQRLMQYAPLMRQILFNRGIVTSESAYEFLEINAPHGSEPENLKSMSEAVDRIKSAIAAHESIAIYGDYDADGVTATALLVQALRSLGAIVQEYIPNRFEEGYGVNKEALTFLHESGVKLVITVDCGMRSVNETDHARNLDLDMIITDHHLPSDEIPRAYAIINPRQPLDEYPYKDLAGVGLAYKLASALYSAYDRDPQEVEEFLDLVAIGTVADMAPLIGENRYLVYKGLAKMRQPSRQGIMALAGVSGLKVSKLIATDLGFAIGPRLNAAGRLESALAAYHLLTSSDIQEIGSIAQNLDDQNRKRQKITREIQTAAEAIAFAQDPQALLIFAVHPDFNAGVVGLAASRLCEQYYRPAIVAHQGDEMTVGSCRSIPELHITQVLDECSDLMVRYGGHAAAAGFTIYNEKLPELIERLHTSTHQRLAGLDLRPTLIADAEVPLTALGYELSQDLEKLQPTGLGNPTPIFMTRGVKVMKYRLVGREGEHLKLSLQYGKGILDAIAFRQGRFASQMPAFVDIMFTYEINEFNGVQMPQLNIRDLRASV